MSSTITGTVPWLTDTTTANSTTDTTSTADNTMGKDQFLELLVTQLKYQDPLDPMDNSQFVAQLATFSSLEQMTNLNTSMDTLYTNLDSYMANSYALQATNSMASMIGKEISYINPDSTDADGNLTGEILTGTVESVVISNGTPYYKVNDQAVSLDYITEIGTSE